MVESRPSNTRDGSGGLAGVFWLAKGEIRRGWVAYPLAVLVLLFLGLLVMPSLSSVFEFRGFGAEGKRLEDFFNAFFVDSIFLVICAFLAINPISSRLLIFRDLPIPARSLVGGRTVLLLFALILNVPAFFLPAFSLDLGELGASYVWFAGTWVGYSLLASGLVLLIGLSAGGRPYAPISICLGMLVVLVLAILEWTVGSSLVGGSAELVRDYGALPAVVSILAGSAGFVILARITAERLQKKDLSS
jgi:hypothetical protein